MKILIGLIIGVIIGIFAAPYLTSKKHVVKNPPAETQTSSPVKNDVDAQRIKDELARTARKSARGRFSYSGRHSERTHYG